MSYMNFNGSIVKCDSAIITADNRGLRYGDGLFETIKYKDEELQLLSSHLDRLWMGLELLQFQLPDFFTKDFIREQILKLVLKNEHSCARVRLTVIRDKGGLYDTINNRPLFIIECWEIDKQVGLINENGLTLGIYTDARKICDQFSNSKHNNFLPYLMGVSFAKKHSLDDALILNQYNRICDSTIANVFIIKDNCIYTPPLAEGCIAGTMRKLLIENLPTMGYTLLELPVTEEQLLNADELFVTNAIRCIKWVGNISEHKYRNNLTTQIYQNMATTFPGLFC